MRTKPERSPVCVYVYPVHTETAEGIRFPRTRVPGGCELMWMLGTQGEASVKAVRPSNHQAVSLALAYPCFLITWRGLFLGTEAISASKQESVQPIQWSRIQSDQGTEFRGFSGTAGCLEPKGRGGGGGGRGGALPPPWETFAGS